MNNLVVNSLPFNPGVTSQGALEQEEELHKFKSEVIEVVKGMNGKVKKSGNISEVESRGLKSLKGRVSEGEVLCCITDKSGK